MTCYGIPYDIYWELLSKPTFIPPAESTPLTAATASDVPSKQFNTPPQFIPGTVFDGTVPGMNLVKTNSDWVTPDYFRNIPCNQATNYNNNVYLSKNNNFPYWLSVINARVDLRVTVVKCCG